MEPTPTPLLLLSGISKRYPGVVALDDVRLTLRAGEIHALMGENGAGKSTLIKVMTGAETPDSGSITLAGRAIRPRTPAEAQIAGISTVYQEVNLIPTLSVAENILLGRQPRNAFGAIDWKRMNADAERAVKRLDLAIDVTASLGDYSLAIQQMVAIARALDFSAKVLVLDEPTSSLDASEVRQLYRVMRRLRGEGMAILFVTHFLDQVYEVSDRITVLRNGRFIGEYEASLLPRLELIGHMMGKAFEAPEERATSDGSDFAHSSDAFLRAEGLAKSGVVGPLDLSIARGEVLGLAGLLGSGRSEIARLLFGVDRTDRGTITVAGREMKFRNPRDAIREGFALVPEDRKAQSIIPHLSIRENIGLAIQARRGWTRLLPRKLRDELADRYIRALNIACAGPDQAIGSLSGGNQQKVILARWLASEPRVLMVDEPTRGIDVGAKAEIKKLVRSLAEAGKSVLFISSELEETVAVSTRVAILRDRAKVGELRGADVEPTRILALIAGYAGKEGGSDS